MLPTADRVFQIDRAQHQVQQRKGLGLHQSHSPIRRQPDDVSASLHQFCFARLIFFYFQFDDYPPAGEWVCANFCLVTKKARPDTYLCSHFVVTDGRTDQVICIVATIRLTRISRETFRPLPPISAFILLKTAIFLFVFILIFLPFHLVSPFHFSTTFLPFSRKTIEQIIDVLFLAPPPSLTFSISKTVHLIPWKTFHLILSCFLRTMQTASFPL